MLKKCHLYEQLLDTRKRLSRSSTEDRSVHQMSKLQQYRNPHDGSQQQQSRGSWNKHNPDEVGRHHSNEEEHQSERFRNMVVEYHIMNQRKVPKSVWLVMAGRLKRFKCVVCVHCHMALDSVLQLENCIFMVVSQTIFHGGVDPRKCELYEL